MNKKLNKQRQAFLLTFFDKDKYSYKEVNGYILVKQWNGDVSEWQVAIHTKDSWIKVEEWKKNNTPAAML